MDNRYMAPAGKFRIVKFADGEAALRIHPIGDYPDKDEAIRIAHQKNVALAAEWWYADEKCYCTVHDDQGVRIDNPADMPPIPDKPT